MLADTFSILLWFAARRMAQSDTQVLWEPGVWLPGSPSVAHAHSVPQPHGFLQHRLMPMGHPTNAQAKHAPHAHFAGVAMQVAHVLPQPTQAEATVATHPHLHLQHPHPRARDLDELAPSATTLRRLLLTLVASFQISLPVSYPKRVASEV
jgi:hypothetical protein